MTDSGLRHTSSKASASPVNPSISPAVLRNEDPQQLAALIKTGDRGALARGITLVESSRPEDRPSALTLLDHTHTPQTASLRVAISGSPGVGKSSLIDELGSRIISKGHSLAVLAVDPSSSRTGGSILGDKTRMGRLAESDRAYIRPSPSRGAGGGVARGTRAAITLCEAAGYDIIFVETVGVGQGETAVRSMTDCFVLLALAGAGDELQGIKRGIVEVADIIAVTKADGDNEERAKQRLSSIRSALRLFPLPESGWRASALACSAVTGAGVERLWDEVLSFDHHIRNNAWKYAARGRQSLSWLNEELEARLVEMLEARQRGAGEALESDVIEGRLHPYRAAERIIRAAFTERATG